MSTEAGGQPSASSGDEKTSNLWSLLPSFDPSMDNAKEYADKVRFLWGICPPKDRGMLAPRLTLLCKGTAWSQVKAISSEKLTNPDQGYRALLKALETWEDSEELQTYKKFERAFYRVVQKGDESALSFVNRIDGLALFLYGLRFLYRVPLETSATRLYAQPCSSINRKTKKSHHIETCQWTLPWTLPSTLDDPG
jgi:hypothetical protein